MLSVALMLRHSFHLEREASLIERGVSAVLSDGWGTPDIATRADRRCSTRDLGERVAERVASDEDKAPSVSTTARRETSNVG